MNPIPLLLVVFVGMVTHLCGGNWMVGSSIMLGITILVTALDN